MKKNLSHQDMYELFTNNDDIPYNDAMAYTMFPQHNWVYNKLLLYQKLNIPSGPFGTTPTIFPIVIKPVISIKGFSRGFYKIHNLQQYTDLGYVIGSFWSPFFSGTHLIQDFILHNGNIKLYGTLKAIDGNKGTFKEFQLVKKNIPKQTSDFIKKYFHSYTGLLNVETIGDNIIEIHLRLNGDNYVFDKHIHKYIVQLFYNNTWNFNKQIIHKNKYIFPIFYTPGININFHIIKYILSKFQINTYNFNYNIYDNSFLSPGGKRYVIFDTYNRQHGLQAKKLILILFRITHFISYIIKFILIISIIYFIQLILYNQI